MTYLNIFFVSLKVKSIQLVLNGLCSAETSFPRLIIHNEFPKPKEKVFLFLSGAGNVTLRLWRVVSEVFVYNINVGSDCSSQPMVYSKG